MVRDRSRVWFEGSENVVSIHLGHTDPICTNTVWWPIYELCIDRMEANTVQSPKVYINLTPSRVVRGIMHVKFGYFLRKISCEYF